MRETHLTQRNKFEKWAADFLKPWDDLRKEDYDFGTWAENGRKKQLEAGCLWEYARESRKARGLLVLMRRRAKSRRKASRAPCSFEGLQEEIACHALGAGFRWLTHFGYQLAENMSFSTLLETEHDEVGRSLAKLHFPRCAVQVGIPSPGDYGPPPWPWQPWSWDLVELPVGAKSSRLPWRLPDRPGPKADGSEKFAIEIAWPYFTDKEIGEEMRKFAHAHRPRNETCKEPTRRGHRPHNEIRSALDALSAMRLASHYPKTMPLKRGEWLAQGVDTAVSRFDKIRLGRIPPGSTKRKITGELSHNEFDRYAARARRLFAQRFPFGEKAANEISWTQRRHG